MSDSHEMEDDDSQLFRNTIGTVIPVKSDKVVSPPPKPAPVPYKSIEDERQVLSELLEDNFDPAELETGDELLFRRPGIQHRTFSQLRSGGFSIEAGLDLHGLTVVMAREALAGFLVECKTRNRKCVKIIHGKGIGSRDGKPVIKNKLNTWLRRRDDVLAFCSARPNDGGTGAVYVLLKRGR